jgi:hypothetical protein
VGTPGEVIQAIGEAYQCVFIGALEANVSYFENKFDVRTEPEKTSFDGRSGKRYSFDFCGVYNHPWRRVEVFGECKGYSKAGALLAEFKTFLAKAYVTCTDYKRHVNDYFWFVTNVPFACSEGRGIRSSEYVQAALNDRRNLEAKEILGEGHIDENLVRSLVGRLGIFILTDSFLMNTTLSYRASDGETLWSILRKLHAGHTPSRFRDIANLIASKNKLPSPDQIISGKRIRLPWLGINKPRADLDALGEF